jgi:hypothetical protein
MMAVEVSTSPTFNVGVAREMFDPPLNVFGLDMTPDGKRLSGQNWNAG